MTIFVPAFPQLVRERARAAKAKGSLEGYVGRTFVFSGSTEEGEVALYPRRFGQLCRVVSFTQEKGRCPLVVEFGDGFRGIAETAWLASAKEAA